MSCYRLYCKLYLYDGFALIVHRINAKMGVRREREREKVVSVVLEFLIHETDRRAINNACFCI